MTVGTANTSGTPTIQAGGYNAFSGSTALGIGSASAVLSDSSNNTYVRATAGVAGINYSSITYDLGNPSVGGSAVARVRAAFTWKNGDGAPANFKLLIPASGTVAAQLGPQSANYPSGSSPVTVYSGWWAKSTAWPTSDLNAMQLLSFTSSTALRYTKAWMEFDMVSTPTATPAITSVTTMRPTTTWTFSDADGYTQASAVVKLFSAAQYGAGGFDPATSTALWSGTVNGDAQTITPTTNVIVTNALVYKPFLQVYKNVSGCVIPSAWSSATSTSTSSFTLPPTPTNVITWSTALSRVVFQTSGTVSPYRIIQFRGTALGTADPNYTVIKDSAQADGTATAYDYFVPRGTTITYGAYVASSTAPFVQSAVAYSTLEVPAATTWELRSVTASTAYMNLAAPVTGISFEQYEGQTVFRPLGSSYPVVVSGDIGGDDGTMQITTTNQTTWDNIKAILDLQSDLYLVAPFADKNNLSRRWFIRVTGRSWTESGIPSAQVRIAQVSFVEVEPPAVAAE